MYKNNYWKIKKNRDFFFKNILFIGKKYFALFLILIIFAFAIFLQHQKNGVLNKGYIFGYITLDFKINLFIEILIYYFVIFSIIFLIYFFVKKRKKYLKNSFLMMLLGTIGNFYQRFFNEGVYDYLPPIIYKEFPIAFNIEDLMILLGTIIIFGHYFYLMFLKKENKVQNLKIIFIDKDIIVIRKPFGVVAHPDKHHQKNTVCTILKKYLHFETNTINPGIVHRLDKQTTGLMIVARNQKNQENLQKQIQKRQVIRKYHAICNGEIKKNKFIVDVPLKKPGKNKRALVTILGKKAISHFEVISSNKKNTLLDCELKTGRTHQLRAHLKYINHPIVNDDIYQKQNEKKHYIFLNAYYLKFTHPIKEKIIEIKIKDPFYFKNFF